MWVRPSGGRGVEPHNFVFCFFFACLQRHLSWVDSLVVSVSFFFFFSFIRSGFLFRFFFFCRLPFFFREESSGKGFFFFSGIFLLAPITPHATFSARLLRTFNLASFFISIIFYFSYV